MIDILITEDNKELSTLMSDFLRAEGYTVTVADSGEKAIDIFEKYGARLVLLDIMLPGMDGFSVCERIRRKNDTPIFILSAKGDKSDKLNGLMIGADDYLEKPFDIDILLAKIAGVFKRRYSLDEVVSGDLRLNKAEKTAFRNDKLLEMTPKEFELLQLLVENAGKTLTKDFLFDRVWGSDSFSEQQTLTVHIKWLREKIENDPKKPVRIQTVWGVGYKFV
ncbi:response regulator transcription factor [Ruminococcus sp. FC2018]|uniref:response regulator transcription factor n=1 Tax=Ruminococcus sp. FC2018 TaxID=1410617 RepID=UPI00048EE644|nr:response regulator transcription factor [Ruminococcus sp. FC2018]